MPRCAPTAASTLTVAENALNLLEVDRFGLDEIDQKIMLTILEKYRGGPVGVNTIAASISEEADTIEEVYEPYLIQLGFLNRTPRGRVATELGLRVLQRQAGLPQGDQPAISSCEDSSIWAWGRTWATAKRTCGLAIERLEAPVLRILRVSPTYETEPVEYTRQRWFLNLVVEAETTCFPRCCSPGSRRIERDLGRVRTVPKGPRTIDIDILLYGKVVVETEDLQIPHPRMAARRFVLAPLADLAPQLRHPITHQTIQEMLDAAPVQKIREVKA